MKVRASGFVSLVCQSPLSWPSRTSVNTYRLYLPYYPAPAYVLTVSPVLSRTSAIFFFPLYQWPALVRKSILRTIKDQRTYRLYLPYCQGPTYTLSLFRISQSRWTCYQFCLPSYQETVGVFKIFVFRTIKDQHAYNCLSTDASHSFCVVQSQWKVPLSFLLSRGKRIYVSALSFV